MPAELPGQVSATEDANSATNPIFVQATDGTAVGILPGTGPTNLGKAVDDAAGATDVGVAALVVRDDALTTLTPADGDYVRQRVDSTGSTWVHASAHDFTNANALPISKDNSANAEANPIFVYTVNTVTSGNEVHDYDDTLVTAASTGNHDYAVTGSTFLWKSVICASSGPFYMTCSTGEPAGTVDFATIFLNGREGDTQQVEFSPAKEVPAGVAAVARVARTNRHSGTNNEAYTTIIGNDVA
jgi:hypothetical protein